MNSGHVRWDTELQIGKLIRGGGGGRHGGSDSGILSMEGRLETGGAPGLNCARVTGRLDGVFFV